MIVGVPKEIKLHEYRLGPTPADAVELSQSGHTILVETGAGEGSGFGDYTHRQAGCHMRQGRVVRMSELMVKVKESFPDEYDLLREGQALSPISILPPTPR